MKHLNHILFSLWVFFLVKKICTIFVDHPKPMRFGVFHCHFHSLNFRPLLPTAILGAWFAYVSLKTRSLNLGFLWMEHVEKKGGGYFVYVLYFVWFNTYAWDWIWIKKSMCICIYYYILYMNFSNTWCIYAARVDRDQPVPHGQRRLHIYTYNPRESKRPGISNISHSFFMFSRCSNGMRGWQKS